MDEEQILMLKNAGYSVNDIGAIIDKDGAYAESVTIDGVTVDSAAGLDEYNSSIEQKAILDEINYSEADGISPNAAKGKNQLLNAEAGNGGRLPKNAEGTIYAEGYEAYKAEKQANGEPVHSDYDGFYDEYEESIYKEMEDENDVNELKDIRAEKEYLEKFHPSYEGAIDWAGDESKGFILDSTGMPLQTPDDDSNWLEKANFWLQDAINDTAGFIAKIPLTKSTGMEDEDAKARYEAILDREKQLIKPIAQKRLVELDTMKEEINTAAKAEDLSVWSEEYDKLAYAEKAVDAERRRLGNFVDDAQWYELHKHMLQAGNTLFNLDNVVDWGTLGIYEAYATYNYRAGLRKKLDNGEELSESDKILGRVFAKEDEIAENGFENNFVTDVIDSTNESLKFLGFGQVGRTVGKSVTKGITKTSQSVLRKVMEQGASTTIQVGLHPGTYTNAGEQYAGKFEIAEGENGEIEILAGQRLYDAQKVQNTAMIADIEDRIAGESNKEKRLALESQLMQMKKLDKALKKPVTGGDAMFYGVTEIGKEVLAENWGGALFKGMTKPIAAPMTRLGRKLEKIPGLNQLNKMNSKGKNFFNEKFGAVPGQKLIGSNTEEIFEEVLVQATPTYGQNWDEYKQQASELGSFDFYAKVAASTMLMQKTMGGVGAIQRSPQTVKAFFDKDERAKRKAMNTLYKEIGNKHISQKDFNTAMMKVGEGNFSIQEYNNSINELREKGLVEEANEVERTKIIKQALLAEKAGNLKGFRKSLSKARFNKNLDPATVANIEGLLPELDNMLDVTYINRTEVIGLNSKIRFAHKSKEDVERGINEMDSSEINDEFDKIKEKLGADETYNLGSYQDSKLIKDYMVNNFEKLSDNMQKYLLLQAQRETSQANITKLEKEHKSKTSYTHQLRLGHQQDYLTYLNGLNKQIFKGKITPSQFKKLLDVKAVKRQQRGIDKKTLDRLNATALKSLMASQMQNIAKKSVPSADVKDDTKPVTEETPPTEPVPAQAQAVIDNAEPQVDTSPEMTEILTDVAGQREENIQNSPDTAFVPFDDTQEDIIDDDTIDFLHATENTIKKAVNWGEAFRTRAKKEPTFRDFYDAATKLVGKDGLDKKDIQTLAEMFEKAELGESNWEQLYNEMYLNENAIMESIFNDTTVSNDTEANNDAVNENKATVRQQIAKAEPGVASNPATGDVIRVVPATGKTRVIDTKAHFAGLVYKDVTEETQPGVTVTTKEDTTVIPTMNTEGIVDVKALLHPDKNNPGDVWNIEVVDQAQWEDIPVLKSDNQREYINFKVWVDQNIPSGLSIEEFMKTDAFIAKVPMLYKDKDGATVSLVGDTDWFNPFNVGDPANSELVNEDLDALTESHLAHIQKGKDNALAHRKSIIDGNTTVRITSKQGSGYNRIKPNKGTPLPLLNEVGTTYPIVFFKVDSIVDLHGNPLNDSIEIVNMDDLKKYASSKDKKKAAIHANRTMILVPVNTTDGKKKFVAYKVMSQNENGENLAFTEDIETAKNLIVAHKILAFGDDYSGEKSPFKMTVAEAKTIQSQIKDVAKVDIANFNSAMSLINGLVKLKYGTNQFTIDQDISIQGKSVPAYKLFLNNQGTVHQNTSYQSETKKIPLKISNIGGQIKVEKLAETYEDYLRKRLSSEIVHYNVGTEESPEWTAHMQPIILLETIVEPQTPSVEIGETGNATKEADRAQVKELVDNSETIPVEAKKLLGDETMSDEAAQAIIDANQLLRDMGMLDDTEMDELLPVIDDTKPITEAIDTIGTLNLGQQRAIITELLSILASTDVSDKKMTNDAFNETVKGKFEGNIETYETNTNKVIANLKAVYEKHQTPAIKETIENTELLAQAISSVKDNYDVFYEKAYNKAVKEKFISPDIKTAEKLLMEEKDAMEQDMYEKNYSQSSNEVIHKEKVSEELRKLFATIGTGKKGFLGMEQHESFDVMYNTISALLVKDLPANPDFDSMIEVLDYYKEVFPWLDNFIREIKTQDTKVKNGFVTNMYKYAANAKFVSFSKQKDGIDSGVWDSNANDIKRKITERWKNNFKRSDITNGNTLNTAKLGLLWDEYESWGDKPWEQDHTVLRDWLAEFGIEMEDNTWRDLVLGKSVTGKGKKKQNLAFDQLFLDTKHRGERLFNNLAKFALQHKTAPQGKLDYTTANEKYHPFKEMGGIMSSLIDIEATHNSELKSMTRRDGGKTVSELVFPTFFFNNMRKLKRDAQQEDPSYIAELQDTAFSQNSIILDLLATNPAFADVFNYGEVGLESLSELFKKTNPFAKIDELSPIGLMFHQRNQFQYQRTEQIDMNYSGFDMRIANMPTPTNSDKGRMMLLKTAVFNFATSVNAFNVNDKGEVTFQNDLNELLYNQLVFPELNRIVNHVDSNVKDYDKGAIRFNLMPEINSMQGKDGSTVSEFLKASTDVDAFKENFGEVITTFLQNNISKEVNNNLKEMEGFIEGDVDKFNNKDYIAGVGEKGATAQMKMKLAEYDFVINSMLTNMETMQTLAGDPAMYFKGAPAEVTGEVEASTELGINLGKRMALMIAPGIVLAESTDEQYLQLMLKDVDEVAQNAEEIIGWHYGQDSLKEEYNGKTYQQHITDLRTGNISQGDLTHLQLRFAKVKDFLKIETTDAQEYTTLAEHLRVLVGLGRITPEKASSINQMVKDGHTISEQDLETVLQPVKPVFTGDMIEAEIKDKDGNIIRSGKRRIMYIKSSSFPLIPQLVNGSKLQPLMEKMNELQDKEGKKVRASYQSANKVGALSNPIDAFDQNSLDTAFERNPNTGELANALVLDRINFKIQQDVPYKSKYQTEDTVSMGTQIFKLLFGDGMTDMEGFELDGVTLNGQELQAEFFNAFSQMINGQRIDLMDKLGLDEGYSSKDPLYTAEKLQELLMNEANERDFPENDVKILEIQESMVNGSKKYHFKMPLWFSGNSNKIESMLNAIINNKVFKQKLPGYAFVVGSEQGFQLQEGVENVGDNKIVHVGDYKGGELKSGEVLVSSKIRVNGELVDLFEQNREGGYKYLIEQEGNFVINEEVIDPALIENFAFRTPTSSHGSGATIKIAGFLPAVMGDLMITPKNFITQMGQDFDVDKLTSYQYYHAKSESGKIEKLNEGHRQMILDRIIAKEGIGTDADIIALELLGVFSNEELREILVEGPDTLDEKLIKANQKFDIKMAKNKFIAIHNAVYNNKSAEVQTKINKVLSMDIAEKQAKGIAALKEASQTSEPALNLLSPTYQMNKLISGSTGSAAIGIYAKGTTFNSIVQQLEDGTIVLQENVEGVSQAKSIRFGDILSNGVFGLRETLSVQNANAVERYFVRSIAEAQDERVNTATDNEKAQVLGRVGITHRSAIAVDNMLSLLGIDTEVKEIRQADYDAENPFHRKALIDGVEKYVSQYSIPYLLHSQPIVQEYFKRLKNGQAIISEYNPLLEEEIVQQLIGEYQMEENFDQRFTGKALAEQLQQTGNLESNFQKEILLKYLSLIEDASKVKTLQETVDLSNLGKSMWESKDKIQKFKAIVQNDDFSNVTDLLGTFSETETGNEGEIFIDSGMYFTPTTNQGVMVGTAISLARNLFFDYFPYYDSYIDKTVTSIVDTSDKADSTKFQETIFQEIKKFITAASRNQIFLDTPHNERKSLFMDTDTNTSLSTHINSLFSNNDKDFKAGVDLVKSSGLLSAMQYQYGTDGKPSIIRMDNTETTNSQESFYDDFRELLLHEYPLPSRVKGEIYTTRMLAQEMIAYSHLSGGIVSQAIEFHKFIPIDYYETIKHTKLNRPASRLLQNYDTMLADWGDHKRLANFKKQFFQNNPSMANQVSSDDSNVTRKDGKLYLRLQEEQVAPEFVSIKNGTKSKLKQHKWSIYEHVGDGVYNKIDTLGEFGMSEYDYASSDLKSVTTAGVKKPAFKPAVKQSIAAQTSTVVPAQKETTKTMMEKVARSSFAYNPELGGIAKQLLELFPDEMEKIKVQYNSKLPGQGGYRDGVIILNPKGGRLHETFVHEFIHAVSSDYLNQFYETNEQGKPLLDENMQPVLKADLPKEVTNLNIIVSEYQSNIQKKFPEEFKAFQDKYKKYKAGNEVVFTPRELSIFYPTINLKEFLAVSLSNNQAFLKVASEMNYKQTGNSILDKFAKLMDELMSLMTGNKQELVHKALIGRSVEILKEIKSAQQEIEGEDLMNLDAKIRGQAVDNINEPGMNIKIEVVNRYSISDLKANPDKIYIFGDNMLRQGKGGQAVIRDEENAFGIRTKALPAKSEDSYWYDTALAQNKRLISEDIAAIKKDGRTVVFPKDGLGTGLALLKEKAPQTYQFLKEKLLNEFGFNNDTGEGANEFGEFRDDNTIDMLPDCI